jgi:hypothetical protein
MPLQTPLGATTPEGGPGPAPKQVGTRQGVKVLLLQKDLSCLVSAQSSCGPVECSDTVSRAGPVKEFRLVAL